MNQDEICPETAEPETAPQTTPQTAEVSRDEEEIDLLPA